jgi:hypothetical protein
VNSSPRPLSVAILAWVYIGVGTVGFFAHMPRSLAWNMFRFDVVWIELLELSAVISGIFLLRGNNLARWFVLAWMAFHVILSGLEASHGFKIRGFAVHSLFCAVIAWILFRPAAARYFRSTRN